MSKMNRLYGVTMPEKGISKLVVNLEKAEELVGAPFMVDFNDFKTRLKIAKSKLKNHPEKSSKKVFSGNAFKLEQITCCGCG